MIKLCFLNKARKKLTWKENFLYVLICLIWFPKNALHASGEDSESARNGIFNFQISSFSKDAHITKFSNIFVNAHTRS